jgi:hypothetical protein
MPQIKSRRSTGDARLALDGLNVRECVIARPSAGATVQLMEKPSMGSDAVRDGDTATYLVECYMPGLTPGKLDALAQRAQQAADRSSRGGTAVWYRSVTFVPQDEMSLFLFEGVSPRSVTEAIERAGLSYERVVEVVHLAPGK